MKLRRLLWDSYGIDDIRTILRANDGGFLVAGERQGRAVVIKLGSTGRKQWEVELDPTFRFDYRIVQMADGNMVIAARALADGRDRPQIASLSSQGKDVRTTVLPWHDEATVLDAVEASSGHLYVLGIDECPRAIVWLLDPAGNVQWRRTLGPAEFPCAAVLPAMIRSVGDGGAVLTGTIDGLAGRWGWVACLDRHGGEVFQTDIGATTGNGVCVCSNGDLLVIGEEGSWPRDEKGFAYFTADLVLVRLDACGHMRWRQRLGRDDRREEPCYLLPTGDGGFLVVAADGPIGLGALFVWLVKVDADGRTEWDRRVPVSDVSSILPAVRTGRGGYLITVLADWDDGTTLEIWTDADGNITRVR